MDVGFSTEYLGYLSITPPLNLAEQEWLGGFADWAAVPDGDPFHLPMNPRAALADAFARRGGVLPSRTDVPRGVHDWVVCLDGDCLMWQRQEKSNDAVVTLRFLVDTYLGPGAAAAVSGSADFADFTFDHRLDGLLAAARDDTDELFLIRVVDSVVTTETLVRGRCSW